MHPLAKGVREGDPLAIPRAISLAENDPTEAAALLRELYRDVGRALRIGITGSPGVGKSTLINAVALSLASNGDRVGVIAVDPTSPFTGGALLGDRIRMQGASEQSSVYIRSMASRGLAGGLARATFDASDILDAAGYPWLILETVGVGQSEIEVTRHTDCTIVILSPESGDSIQAMKAGLLEAADLVCINKADRPGADRLQMDLRSAFELTVGRRHVPIVLTQAVNDRGIPELLATVRKFLEESRTTGRFEQRRLHNAGKRIQTLVEEEACALLWSPPGAESMLESAAREVVEYKRPLHEAAQALFFALRAQAPPV